MSNDKGWLYLVNSSSSARFGLYLLYVHTFFYAGSLPEVRD